MDYIDNPIFKREGLAFAKHIDAMLWCSRWLPGHYYAVAKTFLTCAMWLLVFFRWLLTGPTSVIIWSLARLRSLLLVLKPQVYFTCAH